MRRLYRKGRDLGGMADGLADLFAGRESMQSEAAGMVVAEFLAIMIGAHTEK